MNPTFFGIRNSRVLGSMALLSLASGADGVQYLAVAAGGNFQMGFPYGDTIAISRLPR